MTDKEFEMVGKAGVSQDEFLDTLHLVYMLSDVQEVYLGRLEGMMRKAGFYGFHDKQIIKDAILRNRKVVRLVDTVTSYDYACDFGDKCDKLIGAIDEWVKNIEEVSERLQRSKNI